MGNHPWYAQTKAISRIIAKNQNAGDKNDLAQKLAKRMKRKAPEYQVSSGSKCIVLGFLNVKPNGCFEYKVSSAFEQSQFQRN